MKTTFRYRSCTRKRKYFSDEAAKAAKEEAERRDPSAPIHIYRCQICRARHLTSAEATPHQRKQYRLAGKAVVDP